MTNKNILFLIENGRNSVEDLINSQAPNKDAIISQYACMITNIYDELSEIENNNICDVELESFVSYVMETENIDADTDETVSVIKNTFWYREIKNSFLTKYFDLLNLNEYDLKDAENIFASVPKYLKESIEEHYDDVVKVIKK